MIYKIVNVVTQKFGSSNFKGRNPVQKYLFRVQSHFHKHYTRLSSLLQIVTYKCFTIRTACKFVGDNTSVSHTDSNTDKNCSKQDTYHWRSTQKSFMMQFGAKERLVGDKYLMAEFRGTGWNIKATQKHQRDD